MKKNIIIMFIAVSAIFSLIRPADALSADETWKAIVKIYTYHEGSDYLLTTSQAGSGVMFDNSGLILTNYHVVDVKDMFEQNMPAVFLVCLTTSTTEEPDCRYSADLVAKDKDLDTAILKIRKTSVSFQTSFDYLEMASASIYKDGDPVRTIGYPESGGDTVTSASGNIVGTFEKYGIKWIKTDSAVSSGSSGGAMVDASG